MRLSGEPEISNSGRKRKFPLSRPPGARPRGSSKCRDTRVQMAAAQIRSKRRSRDFPVRMRTPEPLLDVDGKSLGIF